MSTPDERAWFFGALVFWFSWFKTKKPTKPKNQMTVLLVQLVLLFSWFKTKKPKKQPNQKTMFYRFM